MNKDSRIREFTDLRVWQEGHKLVVLVYKITKTFPKSEMYSLTNQMRRSSASVTANIAEGFGRQSYKEKVQFYYLSNGSLVELKDQVYIAKDVGYLSKKNANVLLDTTQITQKLLQGLIKKSKSFINQNS